MNRQGRPGARPVPQTATHPQPLGLPPLWGLPLSASRPGLKGTAWSPGGGTGAERGSPPVAAKMIRGTIPRRECRQQPRGHLSGFSRSVKTSAAFPPGLGLAVLLAVTACAIATPWERHMDEASQAYFQGRYTEAERFVTAAIMEAERPGAEPYMLAWSLSNLGVVYDAQKKRAQAEAHLRRALAIIDRNPGAPMMVQARVVGDTAAFYTGQGRYNEAEPYARRVADILEKARDRSQVSYSFLLNLGLLHLAQKRYGDAERFYQQALAIAGGLERQVGPMGAKALAELGNLYTLAGRHRDAEGYLQRGLTIVKREAGVESFAASLFYDYLGQLHLSQGRYGEGERLLRHALAIWEKERDEDQAAFSLHYLGELHLAQGKYGEAEPLFRRALALREKAYHPEHPYVASTLDSLAKVLRAQGRDAEAEPLLSRALQIREKALRPDHPDLVWSLEYYAAVLRRMNRETEAAEIEARVRAIRTPGR